MTTVTFLPLPEPIAVWTMPPDGFQARMERAVGRSFPLELTEDDIPALRDLSIEDGEAHGYSSSDARNPYQNIIDLFRVTKRLLVTITP